MDLKINTEEVRCTITSNIENDPNIIHRSQMEVMFNCLYENHYTMYELGYLAKHISNMCFIMMANSPKNEVVHYAQEVMNTANKFLMTFGYINESASIKYEETTNTKTMTIIPNINTSFIKDIQPNESPKIKLLDDEPSGTPISIDEQDRSSIKTFDIEETTSSILSIDDLSKTSMITTAIPNELVFKNIVNDNEPRLIDMSKVSINNGENEIDHSRLIRITGITKSLSDDEEEQRSNSENEDSSEDEESGSDTRSDSSISTQKKPIVKEITSSEQSIEDLSTAVPKTIKKITIKKYVSEDNTIIHLRKINKKGEDELDTSNSQTNDNEKQNFSQQPGVVKNKIKNNSIVENQAISEVKPKKSFIDRYLESIEDAIENQDKDAVISHRILSRIYDRIKQINDLNRKNIEDYALIYERDIVSFQDKVMVMFNDPKNKKDFSNFRDEEHFRTSKSFKMKVNDLIKDEINPPDKNTYRFYKMCYKCYITKKSGILELSKDISLSPDIIALLSKDERNEVIKTVKETVDRINAETSGAGAKNNKVKDAAPKNVEPEETVSNKDKPKKIELEPLVKDKPKNDESAKSAIANIWKKIEEGRKKTPDIDKPKMVDSTKPDIPALLKKIQEAKVKQFKDSTRTSQEPK